MLAGRIAIAGVLLLAAAGLTVAEQRYAHNPDIPIAAKTRVRRNRLINMGVVLVLILLAAWLLAHL
jgi:hypothetical protein